MAKRIVFCADGTWNGPEQRTGANALNGGDEFGELTSSDVTNVRKLFANLGGHVTAETLALQNEQEKILAGNDGGIEQVAKYLHGVGDSANPLVKLLGGSLGLGVITRIVRGYTFISRNYVPGDEIHIVGFSRGAYTARALAGMIARIGLLQPGLCDPENKLGAYRLGVAAWCRSRGMLLAGAGKLTDVANHLLNVVETFVASQLPENALVPDVPIKSVAVWDTVGSLGIPEYAGNQRFDVFRFTGTALSDKVEFGFHAMAIDEQRRDFPVVKWDDRENITQVWFAGAHADVGGGYPAAASRLSDEALGWMMKMVSDIGVRFASPLICKPDPQAVGQDIHTPWETPPFDLLPRSPRGVGATDRIHDSVRERLSEDSLYRPSALSAVLARGLDRVDWDTSSYV